MNYDIRLRTLFASDHSLRWDVCNGDLWLECFASPATLQATRLPFHHCGAQITIQIIALFVPTLLNQYL